MPVAFDHLVIAAPDLATGEAWVAERLGRPAAAHGRHATMGTHNALWALGEAYLEVIAVDPDGISPDHPRWFGFDDPGFAARLATEGPQVATFAVATHDLEALAARAPLPLVGPEPFSRNGLSWEVMRTPAAALPLGGAWPLAIRWAGGRHPARMLPEQGLRLEALMIRGEGAEAAGAALGPVAGMVDPQFVEAEGPVRLIARFRTPAGPVVLGARAPG